MSDGPRSMNPLCARTFLFVPGDRPERFAKAAASGADAVIIDLEDAVLPEGKASARAAAHAYLCNGGQALLRINAPDTRWFEDDLSLCTALGVLGVICPKAERPADLIRIGGYLRPGAALLPLIETAKGMRDVHAIAATQDVGRLLFGSIDLSLDLDLVPSEDEHELSCYRAQLVLASRAAGLAAPVDGVFLDLRDEAALARAALAARRGGFGAKLCLHPAQIATVRSAFTPDAEELAWARRVLDAASNKNGAFLFEGRMVDAPVLARARRLVAAAEACPPGG